MFKEYRLELTAITAVCCAYNLFHDSLILAIVCGAAAAGNYMLWKEGK